MKYFYRSALSVCCGLIAMIALSFSANAQCTAEPGPPPCVDTAGADYNTIITDDSFCCEVEWDALCQANYDLLNDDCASDPTTCTAVPPSCVDTDGAAYAAVIGADAFCCDTSWDGLCQDAYDLLDDSCEGLIICAPVPLCVDPASPEYLTVITNDPICCDLAWFFECQEAYNAISSTCDFGADCAATPECVDTFSAEYQQVITDDPSCCDLSWDSTCQNAYDALSVSCTGGCIAPDPCVDTESPEYTQVINDDPFCCDVDWDGVCQGAYDALGGPLSLNPACVVDCPGVGNIGEPCDDGDPNTFGSTISEGCECDGGTPITGNMACSGAQNVVCGSVLTDSTNGAAPDIAPVCFAFNGTGGGRWYRFASTSEQVVTVSTCSATTDFDTQIRVFSGNCDSLSCEAGNDDDFDCTSGGIGQSTATFTAAPGTLYYILVHGFGTSEGTYELSVTCIDPCASTPECVDTESIAYNDVVAANPACCEVAWDTACQDAYDAINGTCTIGCSAIPDPCVDTAGAAYNQVISEDSFCCDVEWDSICQDAYDLLDDSCTGTVCEANGGTLVYEGSNQFCSGSGTGSANSADVTVVGASGTFQRWGLFDSSGNLVANRGGDSQFNLTTFAPGTYTIRYLRYEADVDITTITSLASFGTLEGCWSAASNAITVVVRPTPNGGTLTALSPTTVCADAGSSSTLQLGLSGFSGDVRRYGIASVALGLQVVAVQVGSPTGATFNLNGLPAGTYRAAAVAAQTGTSLAGVQFVSDLEGCYDLSNLVTFNIVSCAAATLASSPNPSAGQSFVSFTNPREEYATLEVYDMSGRMIEQLFNQVTNPGQEYRLEFDGNGLPNGVYLYRLTTDSEVIVDKFMIAR